MKLKSCSVVFLVLGIILGAVALVFKLLIFPSLVYSEIEEIVPLVSETEAYDRWETLPLPITYKIYFFNIENPDEVSNGIGKPILKEVGPYVYQQTRKKYNVTEEGEENLAYNEYLFFEFDAKASHPRTEADIIRIANVPLLSVLGITQQELRPLLQTLNKVIDKIFDKNNNVVLTTTVKEFLFDGIYLACDTNDAIIEIACRLIDAYSTQTLVRQEDRRFKFAFLNHKNDTDEGRFVVNNGVKDVQKLGQLSSWKNKTKLDVWNKEGSCNDVRGTDSTLYPPYLDEDTSLNVFSTDICRSVPLEYSEDITYSGVHGLRYIAKKTAFASPKTEPENQCYCLNTTGGIRDEDGCLLDGGLDLFGCQGGPIVFTYPHFYQSDETYQKGVVGLRPDAEKHQNFVDLEPWSGTPLRGGRRAQFSIFVRPIPDIELTDRLATTLVPFVWLDEDVQLTDELIEQLNEQLLDIVNLTTIVCWVVLGVGILLAVISLLACCWCSRRSSPGVVGGESKTQKH